MIAESGQTWFVPNELDDRLAISQDLPAARADVGRGCAAGDVYYLRPDALRDARIARPYVNEQTARATPGCALQAERCSQFV